MKSGFFLFLLVFGLTAYTALAETAEKSQDGFGFGLGIGIGVQSLLNPDYTGSGPEQKSLTYQSLSLIPEFSYGKFALGFSFIANYRFTAGDNGDEFEVRKEDWEAGDFQEFLEVYLPKIRYARYGNKGDPLFVKLGTIEDATLGNGFILGNYSNAMHLPETRLFGMNLDVDGSLAGFPYLGIETFAANLAEFDLIASRLYSRPLSGTEMRILSELRVGATLAMDTNPGYFAERNPAYPAAALPPSDASVLIYGADFRLPLLSGDRLSLAAFGDGVFQKEGAGAMLGFGGRLVRILTYEAQIRLLEDNFIPTYFGASYDTFRPEQYLVYDGVVKKDGGLGWFASLGLSLLQDTLSFTTNAEGPFGEIEGNLYTWRAILVVKEGVLPGFFFDALYEKQNMANFDDFAAWKEDALIRARLNYRTGPAVISLVYNLRYDPSEPGDNKWRATSGIESTIALY